MFSGMPEDLRAVRDRALLLVGFAGALRRSELVVLRFENVRFTGEGLVVTIPHSKTDPEGEGHTIGIPYGSHPETCPVRALESWLGRANITYGYLFTRIGRWGGEVTGEGISDHQLAKIIKRLLAQLGSTPRLSPDTRCDPVWRRLQPRAAPRDAPSWTRPDIGR